MNKKFISLLMAVTLLISSFSIGLGSIGVQAREVGVGTGAESFNPVKFSCSKEVLIGTDVNTMLIVEVTDKNYRVRINTITADIPYYTEGGVSALSVSYISGTVINGSVSYTVTGTITDNVNSIVRYTFGYDIVDKSGKTVWKNLTGYTYGLVSSKESTTGAVGTYHSYPGNLSDGCYFEVLDTLNTTYVQQNELALHYKIRTQSAWNYHDPRTRGVNVISGNAPSTLTTMPDNQDAQREGQMNWPKCGAAYRSEGGDWLRMSEPESGYYNFTISFNSWNDDWEDQSNITETTEMYYIRNADKVATYNAANKIMKTTNTFADGYYVQKGLYTTESWNRLINAIDLAYQVALSVPNANYGYRIACQNAVSAAAAVDAAFASLERAEHDFYKYKDSVIVEPTCTESGSEFLVCICGEEKTIEIPAHGHDQGEWYVTKIATCTAEGLDELVCTICGDVIKSRTIPMISHDYKSVVIAPTCDGEGYTKHTCVRCGNAYTSDYVGATGHSWDKVVTEPTCTERGYTTYTCTACGYETKSMYTSAKGHTVVVDAAADPTCTETGLTEGSHCSECGYVIKAQEVAPALGHTPAAAVVENEIPATRDEDGSYDSVVYCSACNVELSRNTITVEAIGHDAAEAVEENRVEATCTTAGSYDLVVYCSCCEEKIEFSRETVELPATGHTENEAVVENNVEATCTTPGGYDTVVYCTVCGDELSRETTTVDELGHTEGEWKVTKPADIGVVGEETLYCAVCGEAWGTREIPAISAYFRAAKDTTTVIDKERGLIYGLAEDIDDLEGFVEYEGGIVEYEETSNGCGTGTVVKFVVNGVAIETYTIIIFGDLNGDSVVDSYDTVILARIANMDISVEEGSAVAIAADIDQNDGVVDTYDLAKLYKAANFDITLPQVQEIV